MTDKRFYIVGGKGGVGRSTVAAALGMALSKQGKRTLVLELDSEQTIPRFFGREGKGYEPTEVWDNLFVANLTPKEAQEEYGLMKLKSRAAYRLVFENPVMGKMLNMVPGLRELLLLGKAWFTEQSVDENGEPIWDAIVMDAPATGHAISLFRLPRVILSLMKVGPMASDAQEILHLLTDANRCSFWIVTLPEELPANECMELSRVNEEELHLPLDHVVVNQCWEHLVPGSLREQERTGSNSSQIKGLEETVTYMESRVMEQKKHTEKLEAEYGSRCVRLPFLPEQPLRSEQLQVLAENLAGKLPLLN